MLLSTLRCTCVYLLSQSYGFPEVDVCCRCWQQSFQILFWQPGTAEGWRHLRGALLRSPTSCRSSSRRSDALFMLITAAHDVHCQCSVWALKYRPFCPNDSSVSHAQHRHGGMV